jgi:hypothetical protein
MQIRYNYVPDEHADHVIYSQTMLQVEGYCASVVIIIANVLSDGEHLTPILSHGMPHFAEQYLIILSHCLRVENMTI